MPEPAVAEAALDETAQAEDSLVESEDGDRTGEAGVDAGAPGEPARPAPDLPEDEPASVAVELDRDLPGSEGGSDSAVPDQVPPDSTPSSPPPSLPPTVVDGGGGGPAEWSDDSQDGSPHRPWWRPGG